MFFFFYFSQIRNTLIIVDFTSKRLRERKNRPQKLNMAWSICCLFVENQRPCHTPSGQNICFSFATALIFTHKKTLIAWGTTKDVGSMFISSSLTDANLLINVCLDYVRVEPALHTANQGGKEWKLRVTITLIEQK